MHFSQPNVTKRFRVSWRITFEPFVTCLNETPCSNKARPGDRKVIPAVTQDIDVVQYDATIPDYDEEDEDYSDVPLLLGDPG